MRLGQNFLADTNLLGAIVREAGVGPQDVVLEVGGGEGVLTERLAAIAQTVHVIELDERLRLLLDAVASEHGNVRLHFEDAMKADLGALEPAPTRMVANLPYAIATPLILRTIADLPGLEAWTLMVQREIADRLRARPWTRAYGSPSVLVQLACEVRMLRTVDRAVFTPRPRVDSALIGLRRIGPAASSDARRPGPRRVRAPAQVTGALARARAAGHRASRRARRSPGSGLAADARAEQLTPEQFVALAAALGVAA